MAEDKDIYEIIEELNYEYLSSLEVKLGKRVINFLRMLKGIHYISLYRRIRLSILNAQYSVFRADALLSESPSNPVVHTKPFGKTVIYSCIAGPYDLPREPVCPEQNVDYVLYTDQPRAMKNTVWQYRDIPENVLSISTSGKVRNAYIRMHPKELFPNYDYSIYVDGNMRIMSDLSSWASLVSPKVGLAMHKVGYSNCLYYHAHRMIALGRGNAKGTRSQIACYRAKGMPKNVGVVESGTIVTDLHSLTANKVYDLWWNEFCNWDSLRDQFSLAYVLWQLGISVIDIGTLGNNSMLNPKLRRYYHEMNNYHLDKVRN